MISAMKHDISLFVGLNICASYVVINARPLYNNNVNIEKSEFFISINVFPRLSKDLSNQVYLKFVWHRKWYCLKCCTTERKLTEK